MFAFVTIKSKANCECEEREERMERGKLDRICLLEVLARDEINFPVIQYYTRMRIQYA